MTLLGNYREIMRGFREINIDPSGKYMVGGSMADDKMFVYEIDPETGALRDTGKTAPALYPSCTHFARIG
jgi:6-phosphogluconolactonase (cycloisomerase 2 family)